MFKLHLLFGLLLSHIDVSAQALMAGNARFIGSAVGYTDSRDAITTPDGNLLIVGITNSNNSGDIPATAYKQDNLFIANTRKDGKLNWIKLFGGSQDDQGYRICAAKKGYGVLGKTLSGDGDVRDFRGTSDIWLIRLDEQGNKLWSRTYGSAFSEEPVALAATPDGSFIILGVSTGCFVNFFNSVAS